jgi:Ca-activated chloride channel family protein
MIARLGAFLLSLLWLTTLGAQQAQAWDWFRSENSDVREGNAELERNQLDKALAAYGAAAKRLPGEGGVHLDRGIALLQAGKVGEAREALRLATQGNASPEVRGKAHYNLGLAFMKDADTLAKEENLEEAQKLLRESSDAFKSSLRATPKNRDAAWNLELAKRRLVDLDKKQQEKKDQEKKKDDEQKKKDEDEKKDDQNQDGDKDDENKDGDEKKDDSQGQKDAGAPEPDQADAGAPSEPDAGAEQKPEPKPDEEPKKDEPEDGSEQAKPALPEHMQQALDALENSEENLQKHRAAMRARQRPRRIEKDW